MDGWSNRAVEFLHSILTRNGAGSVPNGPITLYGTCYSLLALHYLGETVQLTPEIRELVLSAQDSQSGLFIGPELIDFVAQPGAAHDSEHLQLHLTCAVLPFLAQFSITPRYPIYSAHRFIDKGYLAKWLDSKDLRQAWFEGNNFLFVGQLLVYLRDVERHPDATVALKLWFDWLDTHIDFETGLWGTNGFCSAMEAVYGGYHQLLVFYYENHPLVNVPGLVDTVLSLQHFDGGFNPHGNGGACEDVDSVDILVHCYKRSDYKRTEIRLALRRCLRHILSTQNSDGGFPYNRDQRQSHMGIPGTVAAPNVSCTFPTWFRIHTLALIAEVLQNEPMLKGIPFRFNQTLGMGWHANPVGWESIRDDVTLQERLLWLRLGLRRFKRVQLYAARTGFRFGGKVLRRLGLRK